MTCADHVHRTHFKSLTAFSLLAFSIQVNNISFWDNIKLQKKKKDFNINSALVEEYSLKML